MLISTLLTLLFWWQASLLLLVFLILMFISALLSASELAFFSVDKDKLNASKKRTEKAIQHSIFFIENPKRLIATTLISNTLVSITALFISLIYCIYFTKIDLTQTLQLAGYIVVLSSILILFGEIIPKIYAHQAAEKLCIQMSGTLYRLSKLFNPLISIYIYTNEFVDQHLQKRKVNVSMSELSDAVDLTVDANEVLSKNEELKLLKGIATFGETEVSEIMHARVDIAALDENTSFLHVLEFIKEMGYSRIPVYAENLDHVKGVLHIKDVLSEIDAIDFDWKSRLRPALFVPENKKINELLQEFKQKKIHLAIVVDEYGGTQGIVTLEDVMEEIVGEISDEFDSENKDFMYKNLNDNEWVFEAKTSLIDLCKIIGLETEYFDKSKGEFDSIAGLLLEIKGDFPQENERIIYEDLEFKILKLQQRRISRVLVSKINK